MTDTYLLWFVVGALFGELYTMLLVWILRMQGKLGACHRCTVKKNE